MLGFQIIVEVDSTGAQGLEISMSPPVHNKSGHTIGGSGAIKYGDQGYIELFSQHYLNVRRATQPNWFYGSENSAPSKMTGWIPDALIPSDALTGKGGFPLTVPPTHVNVDQLHWNNPPAAGWGVDRTCYESSPCRPTLTTIQLRS